MEFFFVQIENISVIFLVYQILAIKYILKFKFFSSFIFTIEFFDFETRKYEKKTRNPNGTCVTFYWGWLKIILHFIWCDVMWLVTLITNQSIIATEIILLSARIASLMERDTKWKKRRRKKLKQKKAMAQIFQ